MTTFHVQRIRSCSQCGDVLPQKCGGCLAHPDRKPRIIELYDWPPILATGPCGCLLIQCQAPDCTNKRWRYPFLKNKEGKSVAKTFCCSPKCATTIANSAKAKKIKVNCAYCEKLKEVWPSVLKARRNIYCKPECHYLHMRKMAFEAKEGQKIIETQMNKAALLACEGSCKDITEHTEISRHKHKCNGCGAERTTFTSALIAKEVHA